MVIILSLFVLVAIILIFNSTFMSNKFKGICFDIKQHISESKQQNIALHNQNTQLHKEMEELLNRLNATHSTLFDEIHAARRHIKNNSLFMLEMSKKEGIISNEEYVSLKENPHNIEKIISQRLNEK